MNFGPEPVHLRHSPAFVLPTMPSPAGLALGAGGQGLLEESLESWD